MGKIIKIEVLTATPPTSRCFETIAALEEVVRHHPDEVRLVVFRRGIDFVPPEMWPEGYTPAEDSAPQEVSTQMRQMIQKGTAVPSCVVDGQLFSAVTVPEIDKLEDLLAVLLSTEAM